MQNIKLSADHVRTTKRDAAWVAEMDAMPRRDGECYFFGIDNGPIKIGHSKDADRRVGEIALEVGEPLTILALVTGGRYREAHYHRMFAAHRLYGEWFERCPEIEAEIARLVALEPSAIAPAYPQGRAA